MLKLGIVTDDINSVNRQGVKVVWQQNNFPADQTGESHTL